MYIVQKVDDLASSVIYAEWHIKRAAAAAYIHHNETGVKGRPLYLLILPPLNIARYDSTLTVVG